MKRFLKNVFSIIFLIPLLVGSLSTIGFFNSIQNEEHLSICLTSQGGGGGTSLIDNDYPQNSGGKSQSKTEVVEIKEEKWEEKYASGYSGGTGTEDNPFLISNAEELSYLANRVDNVAYYAENKYFKLIDDIYLNDGFFDEDGSYHDGGDGILNIWNPIGQLDTNAYSFLGGNFDGGNHTVYGLYLNDPSTNGGLFARTGSFSGKKSSIKNLTIKRSYLNISYGGAFVYNCLGDGSVTFLNLKNFATVNLAGRGGAITYQSHNAIITNCHNYGTISGDYIGGLSFQGGTYLSCSNEGKVIAKSGAGGIVGRDSTKIENCTNRGEISSNGIYSFAGGLTGTAGKVIIGCKNYGNISSGYTSSGIGPAGTISRCTNYGEIKTVTNGSQAGGITHTCNGTITSCINEGNVSGSRVGGIVGEGSPVISSCINTGDISGGIAGGIIGNVTSSATTIQDCEVKGYIKGQYLQTGAIAGRIYQTKGFTIDNIICDVESNYNFLVGTITEPVAGEFKNIVCKINNSKFYYGSDFKGFYRSWKTGEIGIVATNALGCFQDKVTESLLTKMGYVKKI